MAVSKTKASVLAKKVKNKKRLLRKTVQRGDKTMEAHHDMGLKELTLATKPEREPGPAAAGVRPLRGGGIAI